MSSSSAIPSLLMSGGGGHLIAALSTFIGFVATAVWSLVAFTIHQRRAGPDKEDGVFFQQQVVYRNQGSSAHGVTYDGMSWRFSCEFATRGIVYRRQLCAR